MKSSTSAVDKTGDRVQKMFGEIAPRYDFMNHLLSMNVDRYWRWKTVRMVPPTSQAPILDVCTGTGDLALAYYRRTNGQIPVIAGDFCPEMLEIGESKKQRLQAGENLTFVELDAQNLPFADDHFQLVTVAFGLRNVANTDKGLQEMVRVCQPGGRVAVLEFSMPEGRILGGLYRWYFRHVLPKIGQLFARNREDAYNYLPESVQQFPSGNALLERMLAAGLENASYRPFTFGIASLYTGMVPSKTDRSDVPLAESEETIRA